MACSKVKVLLGLIMIVSFCFCKGQNIETFIERTVDSLDRIQSVVFKKVKPLGRTYTINVHNQREFEDLNEAIAQAVEAGRTNICVIIEKGTYRFEENHIALKGIRKNMTITIAGKKRC